jgi:hypothetical protein
MVTVDELKHARIRSQAFFDGANGAATQHRICVDYPRLRIVWSRKDRNDDGKTVWLVDGVEIDQYDFERAVELLNKPEAT